mmetsp:Transcript_13327/g.31526  ORF Transcript_13327/g.31526 Transcript_13327/m.31526 type:complete len:207 (+) Transcript_13327:449-1069(+)
MWRGRKAGSGRCTSNTRPSREERRASSCGSADCRPQCSTPPESGPSCRKPWIRSCGPARSTRSSTSFGIGRATSTWSCATRTGRRPSTTCRTRCRPSAWRTSCTPGATPPEPSSSAPTRPCPSPRPARPSAPEAGAPPRNSRSSTSRTRTRTQSSWQAWLRPRRGGWSGRRRRLRRSARRTARPCCGVSPPGGRSCCPGTSSRESW